MIDFKVTKKKFFFSKILMTENNFHLSCGLKIESNNDPSE